MLHSKFVTVLFTCTLVLIAGLSLAQDAKKDGDDQAKVKSKVPLYFGQIGLSKKQEEDIRKLAEPFDAKIAELRKKIDTLEKQVKEEDAAKLAACEKSLTDGQRAALKERRDTAEAERSSKKKMSKKTANGDEKKPGDDKKPQDK